MDVVGLRVGQLRFWADLEVVSPLIVDEQSRTTEVCGDDRFSRGVTDCTSWDRRINRDGRNCAIDFSTWWMCFPALDN